MPPGWPWVTNPEPRSGGAQQGGWLTGRPRSGKTAHRPGGNVPGRLVTALDGGEHTYDRIAELYFADQAALMAAFGSPEGKATAADYQQIAPPGSRMFVDVLDS